MATTLLLLALAADPHPDPTNRLLLELHRAHLSSVAAAALAPTRASATEVQLLARDARAGHASADQSVTQAAARAGIQLSPPADDEPQQEAVADLGLLHAEAFDHAYVRALLDSHDRLIADVETALPTVADKAVHALVQAELRLLRGLEKRAERLTAKR